MTNWDELLLTSDQSIFFQTSAWAKVLCESYNYTPLYFITKDDDRLSSLIPVMEVNSFLTGKTRHFFTVYRLLHPYCRQ